MNVTTLMTLYNTRASHLFEAVNSIGNYPLLIIDDGSDSEKTLDALNKLKERENVTVKRIKKSGRPKALNYGLLKIDTEYTAIMDSDDISLPNRLLFQMNYLRQHPEVDVLGTAIQLFYDEDKFRKPFLTLHHKEVVDREYFEKKRYGFICNHGTSVYKTQKILSLGGYPDQKRGQDVALWKKCFEAGLVFHNLQTVLYRWRRYKNRVI